MRCTSCECRLPVCAGEDNPALCRDGREAERHRLSLYLSSLAGWPSKPGGRPRRRMLPPPRSGTILVTGGIGDFLAVDAFVTPEYRQAVRRIIWANPEHRACADLVDACPGWPRVEHLSRWPKETPRRVFYGAADVAAELGRRDLADVDDWSITRRFPELRRSRLPHAGSAFARCRLADLSRLRPPARFVAIHPGTDSVHRLNRTLDPTDWDTALSILLSSDRIGVVLGRPHPGDAVPDSPRLLDLRGQTTLPEAVELVKAADGYLGVNSCLSVVAGWHLPPGRIVIASRTAHTTEWRDLYYPRLRGDEILQRTLAASAWAASPAVAWEPLTGHPGHEWCEALGVARQRDGQATTDYGAAYWNKYLGYAATDLGRGLDAHRVAFAEAACPSGRTVLDVGIGCGSFLDSWHRAGRRRGRGFDINPVAVAWLQGRDAWHDVWREPIPADVGVVTLWDVLEHLPDPGALIDRLPDDIAVALSLPIWSDLSRLSASRHYRPGEHLWYWTRDGLVAWFARRGWRLTVESTRETELGREAIRSFAFRRGAEKIRLDPHTLKPPSGCVPCGKARRADGG